MWHFSGKKVELPFLSHLLETNDPPEDVERCQLKEFLQSLHSGAEIHHLAEHGADLEKITSAVKSVLSAIRRIPAEVVGEIIVAALTDPVTGSIRGTSLDVKTGPWVYSQVCRLWRREGVSRSSLWAKIEIFDAIQSPHSAAVLQEILARSRQQPCQLKLSPSSRPYTTTSDILAVATKHSFHWRDVELDLHPYQFDKLTRLQLCAPRLQKLRINCVENSHASDRVLIAFMDSFKSTPALKSISFQSSHHLERLKVPWGQLTEFQEENCYFSFELLGKMPNLACITLTRQFRSISELSPTTLPSLHTLKSPGTRAHWRGTNALPLLTLPSLENLHIDSSLLPQIPELIQRSSCSLRNLSLEGELVDGSVDVDSLASLMPALSSLNLSCATVSLLLIHQIIQAMIQTKGLSSLHRFILPGYLIRIPFENIVKIFEACQSASELSLKEIVFALEMPLPNNHIAARIDHWNRGENCVKILYDRISGPRF
ncbi:hypothetical protein C8J56DRAFT_1062008 [Mycena floridula]|nr:hypothetical protein C8J56DRAFT_1062008 [Mycena floridula]